MIEQVRRFVSAAPGVRVLVAGDCMLDAYVSGTASRISPEAPVPVVSVRQRRFAAGGAANVAANARAMGVGVSLAGVTGTDEPAAVLSRTLAQSGIGADALVADAERITTTKTRITAGQQIVRFDDEDPQPLADGIRQELRRRITAGLRSTNVCVISDYAKGVVDEAFSAWLIAECAARRIPVVVDPKALDFLRYRGATVITPNLKETAAAAREPVEIAADLNRAVDFLLRSVSPSALLVTRGEDGMSLFEWGQPARHLPALVKEVADVTGAGDTVVAALAIALGCGFSLHEAAAIANLAAGVAVSHHGTWAVTAEELLDAAVRNPTEWNAARV